MYHLINEVIFLVTVDGGKVTGPARLPVTLAVLLCVMVTQLLRNKQVTVALKLLPRRWTELGVAATFAAYHRRRVEESEPE